MSKKNRQEVDRALSELQSEEDISKPESNYFVASKEAQRKSLEILWEMVCKYSELPNASADEHLRSGNLRGGVAIVACYLGMMDRATFHAEMGRYTGGIAAAMGGQAYTLNEAQSKRFTQH
jgi:hypothetical protein